MSNCELVTCVEVFNAGWFTLGGCFPSKRVLFPVLVQLANLLSFLARAHCDQRDCLLNEDCKRVFLLPQLTTNAADPPCRHAGEENFPDLESNKSLCGEKNGRRFQRLLGSLRDSCVNLTVRFCDQEKLKSFKETERLFTCGREAKLIGSVVEKYQHVICCVQFAWFCAFW